MKLSLAHQQFQQRPGVVLRKVAGEVMLVPTVTREVDMDSLFLLNASGEWLWEQLRQQTTLAQVAENMAGHFRIEPARATADATAFVEQLVARNLVVAQPAS